jgi:hypothetical protein
MMTTKKCLNHLESACSKWTTPTSFSQVMFKPTSIQTRYKRRELQPQKGKPRKLTRLENANEQKWETTRRGNCKIA